MLIAPTKLHPLWYTPILPLLFLTSAIAVGYPMVVFEATLATTSLKLDSEMRVLGPLTRITIFLLGLYLALKVGDMVVRTRALVSGLPSSWRMISGSNSHRLANTSRLAKGW